MLVEYDGSGISPISLNVNLGFLTSVTSLALRAAELNAYFLLLSLVLVTPNILFKI